jgi:eukaryotic-like serine/threonine-protein kinase
MEANPKRAELRGGREELRAGLLRSALLHLEDSQGPGAVEALVTLAGLVPSELQHDSTWLSLPLARRILLGVQNELGPAAVESRGQHALHPSVLGLYVGMLRQAKDPLDAYRHLADAAIETWRVGKYSLEALGTRTVTFRYVPLPATELDQDDECFCLLRRAELKAIPAVFGLPEAHLEHDRCLSRGDSDCHYILTWKDPAPPGSTWIAAGLGFIVSLPAATVLDPLVAGLTCAGSALLGASGGELWRRHKRDRAERSFERNRIVALEHGLAQHGHTTRPGDLTNAILGGKYRILRTVGSGGIGTVYAAEHLGLGVQVAVKVLRGAAAVDAAEVARLRREARVQVALEHPNVVRTFDLDQLPDGTLYVVMELLSGMSLHELMKRNRPVPASRALPIFIRACRALSAAHRLGIVHRDLKPGNIFLCEGGAVKVLDFGMSKLAAEETLTQEGYTLGTPEYMSPEQCSGAEVDARSDIYAFGVLMYETLCGDLPFRGKTRQALLEHHQRSTPKPLLVIKPGLAIPPELDRVVMACLKKRPSDRPATAQQLERLLAAVPPQPGAEAYALADDLQTPITPSKSPTR